MPSQPLIVGLLLNLFILSYANLGLNCSKSNTSLIHFVSDFIMVQHQLRGTFEIIDDCSFRVSGFDMLEGTDVLWWGALGDDFDNLTSGFMISDDRLNRTYRNDSIVVHLKSNLTWDEMGVVAVWNVPTASDFGHVILRKPQNVSEHSINESSNPSVPTMFENCRLLSKNYRLRWTVRENEDLIDIGLEAATKATNYMAFGWADPNSSSLHLMLNSDVAVTGFTEEGKPFANDFFITNYTECTINKDHSVQGVCPDTTYEKNDSIGLVNNTKLLYGHRTDGVSFIRYQRLLKSVDKKYDWPVNLANNMTVIWALGLIRPPDALHPYYLPQFHGGPGLSTYGHFVLNVSEPVNECVGPLDAEDKEDDQYIITADGKNAFIVSAGLPLHYPNPPNPSKVLYINKKEAPLLRVERGVPVKFSIQAGHDIALYITSDPIGGNATIRNTNETIYAGSPQAHGVPASPTELIWVPDRNTPDHVFYQSLYKQKMGWKVQVMDGGLPDMYNNSVILDDQQVTFFWTLSEDTITIAARGEKKSGYLAIGFGTGMVGSFVYVGWIDDLGKGHVSTYWIDGRDASNLHPTNENLTFVRCKSENGIITLEFTRPLIPPCEDRPECNNRIDPTTPLKVIWAMGATWSDETLGERNMHSATSNRPVRVQLMRGSAEAEQDLRPVLAVHGFMMFLAWGILLPSGILAARYLKHINGEMWFRVHVYLQYSGLAIIMLGLLFAVVELQGFYMDSLHVKLGIAAIVLACTQPLNAFFRPADGEGSSKRVVWEYLHAFTGRFGMIAGMGALVSGMRHLGERYGDEDVHGLDWALIVWFLVGGMIVIFLEHRERLRKRERSGVGGRSNWVLGNNEEDDSVDLLSTQRGFADKDQDLVSGRMEVQLEALGR